MHLSILNFKVKKTHHIYSIILMILFFITISFVMMNDLFQFSLPPKVLVMEKRNLSRKPIPDIKRLDNYPLAYTKYYNDRFPFRTNLISYYAGVVNLKFFHKLPYADKVFLGKDGWMFFSNERSFYEGKFQLDDNQVNQIVNEIHKRAVYYHKKGIPFYLAIPPMKQDVYPEFLPGIYNEATGKKVTEKIIELIKKDTLVKFIDLKNILLKSKKFGRLYFKTDNHWNSLGGYFAYRAILERMKLDFSRLRPLDTADFFIKTNITKGMNLAQILNLSDYIKEEEPIPIMKVENAREGMKKGYKPRPGFWYPQEFEVVREVENAELPKILIVRDSFFYGLMPYIIENFNKTVVLYDSGVYGIFENVTETEKPDLVLYLIFEPFLLNLIGINWN